MDTNKTINQGTTHNYPYKHDRSNIRQIRVTWLKSY